MVQEAQARLRQQAPQNYARLDQGQPLSLADVKALAAAKVSDDVIVSQIRNSRTVFQLSSADIIDLKNSGVGGRRMDLEWRLGLDGWTLGLAAVSARGLGSRVLEETSARLPSSARTLGNCSKTKSTRPAAVVIAGHNKKQA